MRESTRRGLDVLQAALVLGVLGDALLRATPWGLNLLLWMLCFTAAGLAIVARWRSDRLRGEARLVVVPLIFFAVCFVWRDSITLRLLDGLAILLALVLAGLRTRAAKLRLASLKECADALTLSVFNWLLGLPVVVLGDVKWREIPHARWTRHAGSVVRGLLIALPLVLLFGGLLMAADAVFEGLIERAFEIDAEILFSHLGLVLLFSWLAGGLLRGVLNRPDAVLDHTSDAPLLSLQMGRAARETEALKQDAARIDAEESDAEKNDSLFAHRRLSLSIVEIGVVMGLVDLLFLAFVTVQARYFFGDAKLVQTTTGLTYSEYARRGFFELVWVAALVLPLLLIAHWLLRKENPVHERIFRVLAGAQVALLFVIMASAVERLRLYQSEYGLTEQRLYIMAFMAWLAVVFIWFAWTVLRGEREQFACGALAAAFLVIGGLHVVNPDSVIVRVNLAHATERGRVFDAGYAASLSADAVPALYASLPSLSDAERFTVARGLLSRLPEAAQADWRTWNWSRRRAQETIAPRVEELRALVSAGGDAARTGESSSEVVQNR
jgi:hypothetical protein